MTSPHPLWKFRWLLGNSGLIQMMLLARLLCDQWMLYWSGTIRSKYWALGPTSYAKKKRKPYNFGLANLKLIFHSLTTRAGLTNVGTRGHSVYEGPLYRGCIFAHITWNKNKKKNIIPAKNVLMKVSAVVKEFQSRTMNRAVKNLDIHLIYHHKE